MRWQKLWQADWMAPLIALVVLSSMLAFYVPPFWTLENLSNIGFQTAVVVLLAAGQTLVIIAGGIDLSVGSVLALVGVVTALLLKAEEPIPLAVSAGLLVGVACGFVNGFLVTKGRIPPFIATLGMMGVAPEDWLWFPVGLKMSSSYQAFQKETNALLTFWSWVRDSFSVCLSLPSSPSSLSP